MGYEIFADLCKRKGVRPADVGRATGISTCTFSSWKNGQYKPKPEKLQKIADYFGVSLDYLIKGEDVDYYIDQSSKAIAQQIYQNKELHMLLDAAQDVSPDDLIKIRDILLVLKKNESRED